MSLFTPSLSIQHWLGKVSTSKHSTSHHEWSIWERDEKTDCVSSRKRLRARAKRANSCSVLSPSQNMQRLLLRVQEYSRCVMAPVETNRSERHQSKGSLESLLKGHVYLEELPPDIEPIKGLLEKYSGVRAREVDRLIYDIRERLWEIYPFACVGHFRFLSLKFTLDPPYQIALNRLLAPRSKATFLDVGCCVGQVLRQLAYDGVDSSRLYGTDIEPRFLEAGYDLFRDRGRFKATFVIGDMLSQGDSGSNYGGLNRLHGRMNIIHATSFFHLFSWENQILAAQRMVRFLDPSDPDVMIFGRHVGTTTPGDRNSAKAFLHNSASWQELWDEVGKMTGTKWRTEIDDIQEPEMHAEGGSMDETLRRIRFGVFRA
ncbi:uncharacterized protein GGS25DRAFT_521120 [Hypoxylon fragiforme]|uniref:uncharacterized protein n=1 Tax=Hypoxylon fragiforme TaxID=63214 RepID=UPI0020C64A43|nr:uncharacterized protein GGS25DRAFT_521120 [Hypoxylon fragiforme]KAI2610320.1 hypothetical protein GGS25DRAFT_521120 [Hypoxylon fragiforme]